MASIWLPCASAEPARPRSLAELARRLWDCLAELARLPEDCLTELARHPVDCLAEPVRPAYW